MGRTPAEPVASAIQRRFAPVRAHDASMAPIEGRHRAVKIYFVARNDESTTSRVTQGVIDRDRWVKLKKQLAADGFVVTYWCSLEDDVLEDSAA
jgi:hypothetical protein